MDRKKISITILSFLWINSIQGGDVCTRTECVHASAAMLERIDNSVDPCFNFYDFACGNFIQENYTPDESSAVDTFTKLKESIDTQVYMLMLNDAKDEEATANFKLSQKLFKTCLERNRKSEDEDIKALKEIIGELGGWPMLNGSTWDDSKWSLDGTITKIRSTLGHRTDKIFDIASFIINLENANNPSSRPSATFFSLRSAYFNYISNLANFLGATSEASKMEEELNLLLDFEYKLSLINHKLQQLPRSKVAEQQSEELLKNIFYFQWLDYFHGLQWKKMEKNETDEGKNSNVLEEMKSLLNETSKRTLANFILLRVVDFVVAQSSSELGAIYLRFQRQIDGRQDSEQGWKQCVDILNKNLPFSIGAIYVEKYFKADAKASMEEIYKSIKEEFEKLIANASEWVDESTRDKLLNKLQSLDPLIAYPDDGFDEHAIKEFYEDIKIDKDHYLRNLFQLRVIDADSKFRQSYTLTSSDKSNEWQKYLSPTSIASHYSASDNTIRFSAGILRDLLYEGRKINYLGYGSTGFIIAHEISHIVNQIINDAESSEKVQNEFRFLNCLIEQYNEFLEPVLSENLNGKQTAIENIADNTGINLAYRAYRTWSEKFTGKRLNLIGLEDYTWDQLFWLSAAHVWCGVYRREEIKRKIVSDSFATERFRVIGTLQNSPDFARDFNCSQLSPMNRKNKCIIW